MSEFSFDELPPVECGNTAEIPGELAEVNIVPGDDYPAEEPDGLEPTAAEEAALPPPAKHHLEREIEAEGVSSEQYNVMEIFGIEPGAFVGKMAERRGETRDRTLSELAKLLASTGAPKTAISFINLIRTPAEEVRAKAGVAPYIRIRKTHLNDTCTCSPAINLYSKRHMPHATATKWKVASVCTFLCRAQFAKALFEHVTRMCKRIVHRPRNASAQRLQTIATRAAAPQ